MALIKVKVFPESKEEEIIKKKQDSFEIWVKERPVRGQVNQAVIRVLSEYFKVDLNKIRLIKGFKQRNKIFEIK